ncbi:restriction endonuclease subunit S [Levilactobacillus namurensis]|uniref:restriction endonuclease subunit S n=1 Tax=Levilactobacillus namurensis TaxID=380393 RepID=UPI000466664B|nr:restriction endonuclease subunit S [Levilactobacillus namurensis]
MSKKLTPNVRFKGFSDDWKQHKLGDIVDSFSGGTPNVNNKEYYDGTIPFIRSAEINRKTTELYLSQKGVDNSSAKLVKKGDVLYALYGATSGEVGISSITGAINQAILCMRPTQNYNAGFIVQKLCSLKGKVTSKYLQGGQGNLSGSIVKNLKFKFPKISEQDKINNLFLIIDSTIASNQKQLDQLKTLKKLFLKKIFDQEWRFKGFTDPWKQRKLGQVASRVTRKNKNLESTLPLTISAQNGLVDQREFFDKVVASKNVSGYFLVKKGEFAYNKSYSKGYPVGAIKRLDKYSMGVLSTLYIVFTPEKVNSQFLATYYESTSWYREVIKVSAEGARNHGLLNISPNDFFSTKLEIPVNSKEQENIGEVISFIDEIIASNQRKGKSGNKG